MGSLKLYASVAGFLAIAASGTTARGADLLPPPPMPEPFEFAGDTGGWYLRGDVGVSKYEASRVSSAAVPNATFFHDDYGSGGFAGAGVGYQFTNWFRGDVTGEYRFSTGIRGTDTETFVSGGIPVNGFETFKGNLSSAVVLVNGYFDLGTWYGVTPFVGGGVGYAHHFLSGFETTTQNFYPAALGLPTGVSGGIIRNSDKGNFAWALHAGLGYDVSPNLKLEIAYRYLNLGDLRTGVVNCFCGAPAVPGLQVRELESHDVKIGMRWLLGEAGPAEHPPLIRKY
jgi:opacity protein-like surface antigen